jgi:hypothetical protein
LGDNPGDIAVSVLVLILLKSLISLA